ncbi:hypothetical protein HanIR_Chr12g0576061 [Helianthus annuus]|nr:hypothetical protein HanIR_Chr12g0576061 [Helianthus annuus]
MSLLKLRPGGMGVRPLTSLVRRRRPPISPPPCWRRDRQEWDAQAGPPPLSHTYTYNLYICMLGSSPHFLTSILFAPFSDSSYVTLT